MPAIHLLRVVALSLALLAIGAAAITTRSFAAQQALEVHAAGNAYAPPSLMVPTGTAIRFVNDDAEIHTVTRLGGGFDSGLMFSGGESIHVFDTPGVYQYTCLPHPFMVGTIVVE